MFCSLPEAVQAKDKTFPHNTGIHFKGLKMKHFDILSVLTGVCVHTCVCVCVGKFACVHYQDFKLFLKSSHWKKNQFFYFTGTNFMEALSEILQTARVCSVTDKV